LIRLKSSLHLHSNFCDGDGYPEDFIKTALNSGIEICGFSSHAPLPFAESLMEQKRLTDYAAEIGSLKSKWAGKMEVLLGLEIDYIPGCLDVSCGQFDEIELDYYIGSVHYVDFFDSDEPFPVDRSDELYNKGLKKIFSGDVKPLIMRYFNLLRKMVQLNRPPDILGHLDKIRRHNREHNFFSKPERWYRDEVTETLNLMKETGTLLELNTSGLRNTPQRLLYPDLWILREAAEIGVGIIPTSDAHHPSEIAAGFNESLKIMELLKIKPSFLSFSAQ